MTSRPLVILGVIIIVIAAITAAGYAMNGRSISYSSAIDQSNSADQSNASSTAPAGISPAFYQSTTTPDISADPNSSNSNGSIPFLASTTVSTASWTAFTDKADGYSFKHPADLSQNVLNGGAVFSFPKNSYFHWPLLDDAKVTVTVSPACPKITDAAVDQSPVSFAMNGYQFTRTIGSDVGAGQLYTEVAYDTHANGNCYHIDFLDHATDGAGFYVDDASLIAKYDAQHVSDLTSAISIFNGIINSFRILAPTR